MQVVGGHSRIVYALLMTKKLLALGVAGLLSIPLISWAAEFKHGQDRLVIREPIQQDLYAAAGQVVIDAPVAGDVYVAGGSVRIDADINEDLHVAGGQVVINSNIAGDVVAMAGNVEITKSASVGGELVVAVGELTIDPSAKVQGTITQYQPPVREAKKVGLAAASGGILWLLSSLVMTLLLGYGLPHKSATLVQEWRARFGINILWGLIFLIVAPLASILLMVTVVGAPLGLIALIFWAVLLYVGKLVAALSVGAWIQSLWTKKNSFEPIWISATLGVFILMLVGAVPFIGWVAVCLVFLSALGALVRYDWNLVGNLRKQKEI